MLIFTPLMTLISSRWTGILPGLAIFDTRLIKQSLEVLLTQVLLVCLSDSVLSGFLLSYASSELIARTSPNHLGCSLLYCWWDCWCDRSRKG